MLTIEDFMNGELRLVNWRLVVPPKCTLEEIEPWAQEAESVDEKFKTVYTPEACMKYNDFPASIAGNITRMPVGNSFSFGEYKVTRVSEHLCGILLEKDVIAENKKDEGLSSEVPEEEIILRGA